MRHCSGRKGRLRKENRPLLDKLDTERKFILDRRESIFWRVVWNVIVPIGVSVSTVYVLSRLNL